MKVLIVILHADSTRGGAESYAVKLFHKLIEAGHDVFIASASFESSIDPARRIQLEHAGLTRVGRFKGFLRSLDEHCASTPYDIVHSMLPVNRCDVYQPQAGLESVTIKSAGLSRLGNRRRALMARVEAKLLADRTLVLCASRQAASLIPDANTDLLFTSPDDTRFVPRLREEHGRGARATFIGQDFARKGLDVALRAVAQIDGLELHVVGKDEPAPYKQIAQQLGVADRVKWLGARSDVPDILAASDVFIFPTRHEPFGMVIVEAMLMGVPPVVSGVAGAAEVVRDGIDGRVITGENAGDWASAIHDVLTHREGMSAACLSRRAELSYDSHLQKLIGIYERVVAARKQ